ncbi:terminase [Deinococcus cavernae]|uniref:Terminase n=1 Tax=Deinococcus cavernae TaxID=2320857 RepID=A0A418VEB9_9DEIO|nr:terminase [Deinococcus cavernae]RJF74451.1 terminase [Deinococcus cavernae]
MTLPAVSPSLVQERKGLIESAVMGHSGVVNSRFEAEGRRRLKLLQKCNADPGARAVVLAMARLDPVAFLNDWVWLYEPRNPGRGLPARLPLTLRPRQADFVRWLQDLRKRRRNGLVEKSRDEGMTWIVIGYYVWCWLFESGFSGGLGSRKLDLVDKGGDLDTLFEKARFIIRQLPAWMKPQGFNEQKHSKEALLTNPVNHATIKGEGGDNIGRGGRSSMYFVDEHAKVPRADQVHAALSQNTDVIVYGSTPHGRANLFARIANQMTPGDPWPKFTFNWRDNPDKNYTLEIPALKGQGTEIVFPWYLFEKSKAVDVALFEQEVDISYDAETKNQIILGAWVQAALRYVPPEGTSLLPRTAGLDVADSGTDATVYASRAGPVLLRLEALLSAEAPQTVHELATRDSVRELKYDRNGVGASIAATVARRTDKAYDVQGVFNGGKPTTQTYEDSQTPANLRFANYATECWWRLRLRFQRTWEVLEQGAEHAPEDCISLRGLPAGDALNTLVPELSQATYSRVGTSDKLTVNKKGESGKSPNHAEAVIYAFAPSAEPVRPRRIPPVGPGAVLNSNGEFR